MTLALFDDRLRTDSRPIRASETTMSFLDRVDSPYFAKCRRLANEWLAGYPEAHRPELRRRLTTGTSIQQQQAFWELYLYHVLTRSGAHLKVHPSISGTAKTPDFLVTTEDGSCYLEATSTNQSTEKDADDRRLNAIIEGLERTTTRDFALWVTCEKSSDRSPSIGSIRQQLEPWLAGLSADEAIAAYAKAEHYPLGNLPQMSWEGAGWEFSFIAYPRSSVSRGGPGFPVIGAHGRGDVVIVDHAGPLRHALKSKATKYGRELAEALVVACLDTGPFSASTSSYINALCGVVVGGQSDGVWLSGGRPRKTRVSALIVVWALQPWSVVRTVPVVIRNPWAVTPLAIDLPWPAVTVDPAKGDVSVMEHSVTMSSLLGLPADWPGPPADAFKK